MAEEERKKFTEEELMGLFASMMAEQGNQFAPLVSSVAANTSKRPRLEEVVISYDRGKALATLKSLVGNVVDLRITDKLGPKYAKSGWASHYEESSCALVISACDTTKITYDANSPTRLIIVEDAEISDGSEVRLYKSPDPNAK